MCTMYVCNICHITLKYERNLKRHKMLHLPKTLSCSHCDKKFGHVLLLRRHVQDSHCDPKHVCTIDSCGKKFKSSHNFNRHQWYVHNVSSPFKSHRRYYCPHCTFYSKSSNDLKRHLSSMHDIGDKACMICQRNCYYVHNIVVQGERLKACRNCIKRSNNITRKEVKMVEFIKSDPELKPFIALQDQIIQHQSCSTRRRPDLLLSMPCQLHIVVECDEFEHTGYDIKCETGRMNEIIDEFKEGKIVFIRYNPDGYIGQDGRRVRNTKVEKQRRLQVLIDLIHFVIDHVQHMSYISVCYICYSYQSPLLTTSLPCFSIQTHEQFGNILAKGRKRKIRHIDHAGLSNKRIKRCGS